MCPDTWRLANRIMDAAQRCVAPIWTNLSLSAPPTTVRNNGTCGFVNTERQKLLITSQHVLAEFRTQKATAPDAVLAVNLGPGVTVALPEPDVIDEEASNLDLAIIRFPYLDFNGGHDKTYFPIMSWPICEAVQGEAVTIVGFPGRKRRTFDHVGMFEPAGIGMVVSGVSDRVITLADASGTLRTIRNEIEVEEPFSAGGFSGSPGFGLRGDVPNPTPRLIGFVQEGPDAGHNETKTSSLDMLFLSPAIYLLPNGCLDRTRMPW